MPCPVSMQGTPQVHQELTQDLSEGQLMVPTLTLHIGHLTVKIISAKPTNGQP